MDASTYILARVLDGEAPDGPPNPEAGNPMALTGAEQRVAVRDPSAVL